MLDIELFKKINDRYCHDVGDQVLKMVAAHIASIGKGGKAYRYGGEEFALVFAGKNRDEVKPCLETLRQKIAGASFTVRGRNRPKNKPEVVNKIPASTRKSLRITISIGVADNQGAGNTPEEVLKIADKALYRAKKKGRNRLST